MTKKVNGLAALTCGLFLSVSSASASGFALQEQSVSGLGNAFAGGAAAAEDNSVLFTNPAALTLLESAEVQLGVHYIGTEAEITNTGTTSFGVPTQGSDGTSSEAAVVPNIYYSQPVSENLVMGIAVNVPFGLATDWGNEWFGRYIADYSELKHVNIQPTLAYKITDWLSIGIGLDYASIEAELTNAVDMGLVFLSALNSGMIPAAAVPAAVIGDVQANIGTGKYDGGFSVLGDGTTWGYNVGILFQPTDSTRIGLHYRSALDVEVEGNVDWTVGALENILGTIFPDGGGMVDLNLPSITNLSVFQQVGDKWAVMADAQYTTWSSFETLVIDFEMPSPGNSVIPENWNDVWRFSGGVTYQASEKLKIRGGIAWDESPVPSEAFRSPRIPDANRMWYSAGLEYVFSDSFRINAAATYIAVDSPGINNDTHARGFVMKGDLDASVTIFSVSGVYSF